MSEQVPEKEPPKPFSPDVGDYAAFIYWYPFAMPDDQHAGRWDVHWSRVISVGRNGKVCYASHHSTPMDHGDGMDPFPALPYRFADADKVYKTQEDAREIAAALKNPNKA